MRVKTGEKRSKIVKVASEVFGELGFHRASMAAISARLGGSKATLYGYFKSKEQLFAAVLMDALEEHGNEVFLLFKNFGPDVAETLTTFGRAYLKFLSRPEVLAVSKMAMSDGASSNLAPELYQIGKQRGLLEIQAYLQRLMDNGVLLAPSAQIASLHLKALLEAGVVEPQLYGVEPHLPIDEAVEVAVSAFMKAYMVVQAR
ncbi:TetR/AcrR family transcriptional regulator [Cohaesibacter celericrescens]|uniref:TetR/AcrR family transcriptional regulator n=1 Tax=Cohaesibacter celericrescens TaxID=2067669 RepID=UPI0035666F0D